MKAEGPAAREKGRRNARSREQIDDADLDRLDRAADCDLERFFVRNPHLVGWGRRVRVVALAQGAAEHRVRGKRGVWDLDLIVCFAATDKLVPLQRRRVVPWDWGPSKFGRCPYDPPSYSGRAVDVKYWVIPDLSDPAAALRAWLSGRLQKHPDPDRKPDVAHEPVILVRPHARRGEVVWDPDMAPPAKTVPAKVRHPPAGLVPP
jgi:hypothetical protein